ncbi:MAG: hypothetical protein ABIH09_02085, partial [Candidatus Omnitrophota bacterium]
MTFNFNFDNLGQSNPNESKTESVSATKSVEVVEQTPFDVDKSLAVAEKHESILAIQSQIEEMRGKAVILKITDDDTLK